MYQVGSSYRSSLVAKVKHVMLVLLFTNLSACDIMGEIITAMYCSQNPNDSQCQGLGGPVDSDGDDYDSVSSGGDDCNDNDSSIHPGATEICNNVDDDCDGSTDEDTICDTDSDGIDDDGDYSGDPKDNPCAPGASVDCDDNCYKDANPDQLDFDGDGTGDMCDNDDDNDGVLDDGDYSDSATDNPCADDSTPYCDDNCALMSNPDQTDSDGDGVGNACDDDSDNDGIPDDGDNSGVAGDNPCTSSVEGNCDDNCLSTPNPLQVDQDGDSFGDDCDNCPTGENPNQADWDLDGLGNVCDNCPSVTNPAQIDINMDGIGDACLGCYPSEPEGDFDTPYNPPAEAMCDPGACKHYNDNCFDLHNAPIDTVPSCTDLQHCGDDICHNRFRMCIDGLEPYCTSSGCPPTGDCICAGSTCGEGYFETYIPCVQHRTQCNDFMRDLFDNCNAAAAAYDQQVLAMCGPFQAGEVYENCVNGIPTFTWSDISGAVAPVCGWQHSCPDLNCGYNCDN